MTTVRARLLYVEDDAEIAEMTLEVLSETYDVVHESDGVSGRDRALRERFDVIQLDWRLPQREGAEIVRDPPWLTGPPGPACR